MVLVLLLLLLVWRPSSLVGWAFLILMLDARLLRSVDRYGWMACQVDGMDEAQGIKICIVLITMLGTHWPPCIWVNEHRNRYPSSPARAAHHPHTTPALADAAATAQRGLAARRRPGC